jgi:membrane-associated phospholipid phosphatase
LRVARWIWEQRWGLSIAVMLIGAAALTAIVRNSQLLAGEVPITQWLSDHDGYGLGRIAEVWDVLVTGKTAPALWIGTVLVAWWSWGRYAGATVFGAGLLTAPVSLIDLAARPRPTASLEWITAGGVGGYPSGHVMFVILIFGALAFLAGRHMAIPWQRNAIPWGIWTFIALMGPARLMSLTHWPADIGASYLIAFPQLLFVYWMYPRVLPYLRDNLPWAYAWLHGDRVVGTRSDIA